MKKFFAMLVVAALLASLCALTVNAEVDEADWKPFGEVKAEYVENLSDYITLDGDVSDWQTNNFQRYDIDKFNLDPWVGEVNEDWSINLWFSADAQYLYIAFKINDKTVLPSDDGAYNGDAFQIQLDFGGWAAATETFDRAVFYSFGLQEDNTVDMTVQCIYSDGQSLVDYTMASDDEEEFKEGDVKGVTKAAEDGSGWYAEFAISWQTLYNDISNKLLNDELEVPAWTGGSDEISLNMLICYLDHNVDEEGNDAGIVGAWGTSHQLGSLGAGDGWYPESAGMTLTLSGMSEITIESTEAPTTEEPTTEAPTTEAAGDATEAPSADATTTEQAPEATTDAGESKGGCSNVIGAGAVVAVLALGVCVVAKKKD